MQIINFKDPLQSKVSLEILLKGAEGLSGLGFVNLVIFEFSQKMLLNGEKFVKFEFICKMYL